jgi:hypothetical protein
MYNCGLGTAVVTDAGRATMLGQLLSSWIAIAAISLTHSQSGRHGTTPLFRQITQRVAIVLHERSSGMHLRLEFRLIRRDLLALGTRRQVNGIAIGKLEFLEHKSRTIPHARCRRR